MKANQKSIIDGTEKSKKIAESMNVIFVNSIELTRDAEMTADQKHNLLQSKMLYLS